MFRAIYEKTICTAAFALICIAYAQCLYQISVG
jgi:hypothetical protein